ncbi:MAG: hypothetical protein LKE46_02095 [Clostridium sp.]|jgi:hypothetical protein|uniref:hypothetical protein n=1 Tax=Clostridium sp. TaxID=1506 RepID=UPI0025C29177|nr:hypothetical protein [Clostridium sp.]MCH3963041.1 hypothetical protein [Clostridium sp.]MCI1716496.1 hypothetical protein [Clostridium sp.]MCI1800836.1 hypothetical protein [Clostridium sp.]MCI1814509.1 hypothetical protein [Clostridium sp.]MCI1871419.1 hypothetical protein [Clostridium sp.]
MISKNEPPPNYMSKYYYEYYAKVVLEELYPEEFTNLKKGERPDLQNDDKKWGVEVTTAIGVEKGTAESLYMRIYRNLEQEVEKDLKRNILREKADGDSFDLILRAFNKKLNKLNGYKYFRRNGLFIFSDIYADDEMIMKVVHDMKQLQKNISKKFYEVFVLVPGKCYCLNLYTGRYKTHPIESETQTIHAIKAGKLVEKYGKTK